ncbi:MAG: PAS domain-containing sensor histidine kinase, partial [Cyclobacteriaceae bacterium]|nr:PAS domain-containing sensor histidine kinase [Cyclobacteriaceae bacterium]
MESIFKIKELDKKELSSILYEVIDEGLVAMDIHGVICAANPSLEKLFGYNKKELLGKNINKIIPDDFIYEYINLCKANENHSNGQTFSERMELTGVRKDGSIFPMKVSLNFCTICTELVIVALISDITQLRDSLEQLKKENETAKLYLNIIGTMLLLIDKDQTVKLINKKGCEILGYGEDEILGKNWFDNFIPKENRKEAKDYFIKFISGKARHFKHYQNPVLTKSGEVRTISWHNIVVRDENGDIVETLSSGDDITEQINTEQKLLELNVKLEQKVNERTHALVESQRMYQMIARNFPNGVIYVLDKKLNYVFVEGMDIYKRGITGEMLVGTNFLKGIDIQYRTLIMNKLKSVFEGNNSNFELNLNNTTYMISATGLVDKKNKINQILLVSQDVSTLKKAEEDMRRSLEKERYLNELKTRFVSMASHEFRTPLTSIMNSVTLLSKYIDIEKNDGKSLNYIERIKTSIQHLNSILNDFLSLDKLEEGKLEINCSKFSVTQFFEEVIEEINSLIKKGQQIEYDHIGKEQVFIDKQMMFNIFNNLL